MGTSAGSATHPHLPPGPVAPVLVGRETELRQLQGWFARARRGERQVVFVTGEPGIGKTTLVDALCASLATEIPLWLARGQCLDQLGAGEAYLPVLDALGQLCRGPAQEPPIARLAQQAHTWLLQMPALLGAADLEALQQRAQGTTRERMLRELAEALEALTAEQPLVLEDLHWSDAATVDLLVYLARRRAPAQLLLIGTYRAAEVIARRHPLRAVVTDLALHGHSQELALELLTKAEVAQYLASRFAGHEVPADLARLLHSRTDGNPLFLVTMVAHLLRQGWMAVDAGQVTIRVRPEVLAVGVPESLRALIDQQLEQLSGGEQQVLEAASVAGVEWSAAVVAAGVGAEVLAVEAQCEGLVRRGEFLQASGVAAWPDGTVAAQYGFRHALYQQVVYERIPAARRQRLHQQIGARLEQAYDERLSEIATALAMHRQQAGDAAQAVRYRGLAAQKANRRSAPREAIEHVTQALRLLKTLPATRERTGLELRLHLTLLPALLTLQGFASPEVARTCTHAQKLWRALGETLPLSPAQLGLWREFYWVGPLALPFA